MTDNSNIKWNLLSDTAIEREIGHYIKKLRQQQNKTQQELADQANISRSTLSLLERGTSGSLKTLIQLLRILGKLQILESFEYQKPLSPLTLAKAQHKTRERVKHRKTNKTNSNHKKSNW